MQILSFRERRGAFSLGFQPFGPSVLDGARRKSIYAARATRGHRFGGVPTTPRGRDVRPEKFQFLEKGQNRNFGYQIVISVKNLEFIL